MVEKGAAVVKMWSNQEKPVRKQVKNLCEVVAYAMHSSGKTSLAVWLSPYKIAKIDALASKLAGRYFHYFAWLVAFTKSSQIISTHLLTVLISGDILYSNKREREKSRRYLLLFSINTSDLNRLCKSIFKYLLKGDMTYDDA